MANLKGTSEAFILLLLALARLTSALGLDMDMRAVHTYQSDRTIFSAFARSNLLYLGTTSGSQIIDVSDPIAPKFVGESSLRFVGQNAFHGNFAYVSSLASEGFWIYDMSTPMQPAFVKSIDLPERASASKIVIRGDRAYISSYGKLLIFDLADALAPALLGSFTTDIFDFAVAGSIAYVAAGAAGLVIVDVSNPLAPALTGSIKPRGSANIIEISRNYAYVSDLEGVSVVDVSDPANPVLKTKLTNSEFRGVLQMTATDSALYIVTQESVVLLPTAAEQPGARLNAWSYHQPSEPLRSLALAGDRLFAISLAGFTEFAPFVANPQRFGQFSNVNSAFYTTASGDLALIAGATNLNIIDISNISNPVTLGAYSHTRGIGQMKIFGNFVYFNDFRNVGVLDISDRAHPTLAAQFDAVSSGNNYSIDLLNEHAFVATAADGLKIYNVSDPRNPTFVTSWRPVPKSFISYVLASNNRAFVGAGSNGLFVLDVSDPIQPQQTASVTNIPITTMAMNGSLLVASSVKGNLDLIDMSNPDDPIRRASIMAETGVTDLTIVSDLLYVSEFTSGIEVYDISAPSNPRLVGGNAMFTVYALTSAKGKILAASSDFGGVILNCFASPALSIRFGSSAGFNLQLSGPPSISAHIDRSVDLIQWQPWTNVLFTDVPLELPITPGATGFYRTRLDQ